MSHRTLVEAHGLIDVYHVTGIERRDGPPCNPRYFLPCDFYEARSGPTCSAISATGGTAGEALEHYKAFVNAGCPMNFEWQGNK